MLKLIKSLLDWIFYSKCYFCGKTCTRGVICEECSEKIKLNSQKSCRIVKNIEIYSLYSYKNEIQKLIRGLKYHNKKEFAPFIAEILFDFWKNTEFAKEEFEIIAVPMHKKRLKQRKYNHTEIIADEFSKLTGYSVNTELVLRIKDTKPQYKLSKTERMENLKDAFFINKEKYSGTNLLLLDDICTTGVTFQEIVAALNKAGINKLFGLVISTPD